ncbi:flagellar brake protein [uncultured Aquabacterium sp.]|uniref:flagellar brake protein n=1 Tax=Aquabacterium sp. TaxID=1872578 RepID=UPI0025E1E21F|nr:flagellar brake protein [uncultured Aquabacterium sp.]
MDARPPSTPASRGRDADLDDFRIGSSVEVLALLRQMYEARALVTLSTPAGDSYTTVLEAVDAQRRTLQFGAGEAHRLRPLLDNSEVTAVAYLDSIKVQFDVDGLVRVHGDHAVGALNARLPDVVYRFQRRGAFRVQPLASTSPVARIEHHAATQSPLALRVLDVSLQGVALLLPEGAPAFEPGMRLEGVDLELDDETRLTCDIAIQHITVIGTGGRGKRLGCQLLGLDPRDRTLALYVNQTQKRRLATLGSAKGQA